MLTSPESVYYATGYATAIPYQTGKLGLTMAVVTDRAEVYLFCTEFERQNALATVEQDYVKVVSYPTWVFIEDYTKPDEKKEVDPNPLKTYAMAVEAIPQKEEAIVGVEPNSLPYKAYQYLASVFGEARIQDCSEVLREARVIKTPWEIENLRKAAHYTELAMQATAHQVVPGMDEADIFRMFQMECFKQSSDVIDVFQAHTVGADFAPAFIPRRHRINYGDIIRLDGGVKVNAYNADIARTFAVGKAIPEREKLFEILYAGFAAGKKVIEPGVPMQKVFVEVQKAIEEKGMHHYIRGHHGHSLGICKSPEEAPYLAPEETRVFEPGMVMCMEVPYYSSSKHSYNIEDTFVITENGVEFFTEALPTLYI